MLRRIGPVIRAVLIAVLAIPFLGGLTQAGLKADPPPPAGGGGTVLPTPRPTTAPPEPAAMGWPMYSYPVYPGGVYPTVPAYPMYSTYGYGYLPPRGPWGPSVAPVPAPYPGSAMGYPYPRSVSSYSSGPWIGTYPPYGPAYGPWMPHYR